ncbi:hypothetical protein C8R42DRAFT_643489 [Lentinula raphanica]|nr:hypothetical protein C8R42DRAFT_643489 [Lentinula raphanica]
MTRFALVYVVGAVSTALAAPTSMLPPSEALSGHEERSNAPLHQLQPADGFPATARLNVGVLANSVTTSGEFFGKTWSLRDGADVHDILHITPSTPSRLDGGLPMSPKYLHQLQRNKPSLTSTPIISFTSNTKRKRKLHDELAGIPSDQWGETENRRKISKAADNDRIVLRHLKNAHSLGNHFSVGVKGEPGYRSELLPDLAQEQARVQNLKDTYENALRGYVPEASIKRAGDLQASSGKRRKTRGKNTESSGIPPDNLHVFPANTSGDS